MVTAMLLALLLACHPAEPPTPARAVPTVGPPTPHRVEMRPFERGTFQWTLEWPNGEVPEGQYVIGNADGILNDGSAFSTRWAVPNEVFEFTYTASRHLGLRSFATTLLVKQEADELFSVAVQLPLAEVDVRGGPAEHIHTWGDEVRLGVGEVRVFQPYPVAEWAQTFPDAGDERGEQPWSEEPVSYAIVDPAVAEVDALGVITAGAPGETTLVLTAGDVRREVPVTVETRPLDRPPLGAWPLVETVVESSRPLNRNAWGLQRARVAVGPDGGVSVVFRPRPGSGRTSDENFSTLTPPLVLATWTGTGFGFEMLGTPTERLTHAGVAVDERGDTYVLTRSLRENRLDLWHRPAGVPAGGWTRRALPVGLGAFDGPGDMGTWSSSEQLDRYWPISMTDRPGGGVWIAWVSIDDFAISEVKRCPRIVRAASAGPQSLEVEIAQLAWLVDGWTVQISCEDYFEVNGWVPYDVGLAAPMPVGAWPWVLIDGYTLKRGNGAWTAVDGAPGTPSTWDHPPSGHFGSPAWDDDPLTGTAVAMEQIWGWTTTGRLTHVLAEDATGADTITWLHTRRELVPPGGDEPTGWALYASNGSHVLFDDVLVLDDGTRFLRSIGEFWSFAPDAEPAPIAAVGAVNAQVHPWVDQDGLRVLYGSTGTGFPWVRWDGAWTQEGALPPGSAPVHVGPSPTGEFWVLTSAVLGDPRLVRIDEEGATTVLLPEQAIPSEGDGVAWLPDGGAAVIHRWHPTPGVRRTARYDADGALVAEGTTTTAGDGQGLIGLSDGTVLMPPLVPRFDDPDSQRFWRSTDGVTWDTSPPPPGAWSGKTHLRVTDGGALLWVGTRDHGWYGHQAALVVTEDGGLTWSEPVWVREEGSPRQQVASVALDGDDVLVLIVDNGDNVPPPAEGYGTDFDPRGTMLVRVPLP